MKNLIYQEMTINDYDQAYKLWQATTGMGLSEADSRDNIDQFLKRNQGLSLVCKDNEKIIGTVLIGHDGRRGYIYHLAVIPEYRMKGIAKELMIRGLNKLRGAGITKCHLFVFKDNELGKNFWTKTGWMKRENIVVFSKDTN